MGHSGLRALTLGAALSLAATAALSQRLADLPFLKGVNLPSAAFADHLEKSGENGRHGRDYAYPIAKYSPGYNNHRYFLERGMNAFRIGFLWERLQPSPKAAFEATEFKRLKDTVTELTKLGAWVVLDPHNYARYRGQLIGAGDIDDKSFADLWRRLAEAFKDDDRVIFGLMNEPYDIKAARWAQAANAAIRAIRDARAPNVVLVPGISYSSSRHWREYGNAQAMGDIRDPADNIAFEAHTYLNASGTGLEPDCDGADAGVRRVKPFAEWLRKTNNKGFLGEFGAGSGAVCLDALANLTRYLERNRDIFVGWAYWAAGPRWPPDYFTSIEPRPGGGDAPQTPALLGERAGVGRTGR